MSGAGKWIKKHPVEAIGGLALLGTGGAGLAGMGPLAGLLGSGATVAGIGGANVGAASVAGLDASLGAGGGLLGGGDKYLKMAQMGMGAMDQPQQPMAGPQLRGPQGPGQQLQPPPMYGDPELEKRKQYEMWLAQQGGGIYG